MFWNKSKPAPKVAVRPTPVDFLGFAPGDRVRVRGEFAGTKGPSGLEGYSYKPIKTIMHLRMFGFEATRWLRDARPEAVFTDGTCAHVRLLEIVSTGPLTRADFVAQFGVEQDPT